MNRKIYVIAGPYRMAKRFAERRGWAAAEYIIVTRAHQLARLDPALIMQIFTVKLHDLGRKIVAEIHDEIEQMVALFPVPMVAAA